MENKTRITLNLNVKDATGIYQTLLKRWIEIPEHSAEAIQNQELRLRIIKQLTDKNVSLDVLISEIHKEP